MDSEDLAKILEGKLQLNLVPKHHWRQVISALSLLHKFIPYSAKPSFLFRKLLGVHDHCHFFVTSISHLASIYELACLLLDSLTVMLQLGQGFVTTALKVLLSLTINFKTMRHRSPLASVSKFLSGSKTLFFVASYAGIYI